VIIERNPILQSLGGVHSIWNARKVTLYNMGRGRVGFVVKWTDDGPDRGRRYPDFWDVFIYDLSAMSKWDLQTALWLRLENRRSQFEHY